ncbi:hypothetical protein EMIHUDRAFT_197673 [Emiliania huxleyi CCMP1516]|uniref:Uncharacterized protein n=2 Tax=Emiliania huxleyi TaxID=2903 RepID=A0A0D3IUN6_EMIH1|nr:hypothetical protein EMIHUDRAFT_197673 [Emiliania huxleyi CCMP1516]EOD14971.1 hypothetical protein EMIHUDRAFT_197673 [Emiliania huxleyi CCMP1516]|eukprot:XP_005767400.1 hypothetical protein EMIHUDRAFT_197673 [Emiliania huxleyi CCMP1516]
MRGRRSLDAPPPSEPAPHRHHKNVQRSRRRSELRAEVAAATSIDEALEGVRAGGEGAEAAARSVLRLSGEPSCCELAVRGLPALVECLRSGDVQAARPCAKALARLCAGAAERQDAALAAGTLGAVVDCLAAHGGDPSAVAACGLLLQHLATGVGAAARRAAAMEAGVLPAVAAVARRWDGDCAAILACRAAVRSLTRDSAALQSAARTQGVPAQWLL